MADNKTQIVITAKDETKAAFTPAENGMRGLAAHANSLTGGLGGVQRAATTLIPVLGGLGAAFSIAKFAETISSTIKFAAALDDMAETLARRRRVDQHVVDDGRAAHVRHPVLAHQREDQPRIGGGDRPSARNLRGLARLERERSRPACAQIQPGCA